MGADPFGADKIMYHPDRLNDWWLRGDTRPVTVELDLTNRCNHRCPYCTGGRAPGDVALPAALVERTLDELQRLGVKAITFTGGGEPLCHPQVMSCVDYARRRFDVGFITNGALLAETHVEHLRGCAWVRVSLDADGPEMYRLTHGTDNFAGTTQNIRLLAKMRDSAQITIGAGYLVDSRTVSGMANAAKLCAELGVHYLQFRPFHHAARESGLFPQVAAGLARAKEHERPDYRILCSTHKFNLMAEDNGTPRRTYRKCYGQAFAATICANGDVTLCCHMRGMPQYTLGNLHEQSFDGIWRGRRRQEVIEALDFRDCPDYCRCDPFNRILWNMKHEQPAHVNFL